MSSKPRLMVTFDIEDNFTRDELRNDADWAKYEGQVLPNTEKIVALLQEWQADATFFVLGKVADRRPEVVRCIARAGFEIASHGYAHELVHRQTEASFEDDLRRSLGALENVTGKKVVGYRARSFSITRATPWALDVLARNGIEFDSSLTDIEFRALTGQTSTTPRPLPQHPFVEVPISTAQIGGRNLTLSGGSVLRLAPYPLYACALANSASFQDCPMVYSHAWEFNRDQPQRKVGLLQSMAQASWTYTTQQKLERLARDYELTSMRRYLRDLGARPLPVPAQAGPDFTAVPARTPAPPGG